MARRLGNLVVVRLFAAIYPPASARDEFATAVGQSRLGQAAAAGRSVGLTAPERWHVTVAFLGELPEEQAPEAVAAVAAGVDQWRARGDSPLRLRLAGAGRFGRGKFTVMWAGLDGDVTRLRQLAADVGQQLRRSRLPFDDRRPFRPHLTFARPAGRIPDPEVVADLAALSGFRGRLWRVDSVQLMRSRLGPTPTYTQVATAPLQVAFGG